MNTKWNIQKNAKATLSVLKSTGILVVGTLSGAFASSLAATGGTVASTLTFTHMTKNLDTTEYDIIKIMMIVLVFAGIMLILKGLIHLKQQYTSGGGGQEKHLSKGIASCVFGACMFMVIPLAHLFTNTLGGGSAAASWNVGASAMSVHLTNQTA
jgi:hypothetical protein